MTKAPMNATEYLKPLLDFAAETIPSVKHTSTPLYILATAGLRFLTSNQQSQLLEDLFNDITRDYKFLIEKTHIEVISGQLEGIYSWIAINYVLGRFHIEDSESQLVNNSKLKSNFKARKSTVGVLDMGGASAQIAFEVLKSTTTTTTGQEMIDISLGYNEKQEEFKYRVYVTTFLGYGANRVFEKYIDRIISIASNLSLSSSTNIEINDADCLPRGYSTNYTKENKIIEITGDGDFENCVKHLVALLNLNSTCIKKPCSFNGVYQPRINYDSQDFYGFSEFWYTMQDVLKIGGPYTRLTFLNVSTAFCNAKWNDIQVWYSDTSHTNIDKNRLILQCFKSAWLYTFLHIGLKFPLNYEHLRSASLINNNDVQWTLGAIIHRTRFFPLSAINRMENTNANHGPYLNSKRMAILTFITSIIFFILLASKSIRSLLPHRKASQSSSNMVNYRYKLLATTIVE